MAPDDSDLSPIDLDRLLNWRCSRCQMFWGQHVQDKCLFDAGQYVPMTDKEMGEYMIEEALLKFAYP